MSNRKPQKKGQSKPRPNKMAVRQATMADRQPIYRSAFAGELTTKDDQLINRGSNGGLAGADKRILHTLQRAVMINGIDNHHVPNIPVGTCCGLVITHRGPAITDCHEYALTNKGASIHSSLLLLSCIL